MTQLTAAITQWDGQSVDDLKVIYRSHHRNFNFEDEILQSMASAADQQASTWLLKHHLEHGHTLNAADLLPYLGHLEHWSSTLHILQCMDKLIFQPTDKHAFEQFVRSALSSNNKFVRAWAYSSFHLLAQQFFELKHEAAQLLALAEQTEAPSVKARIRQIPH